MIQDLRDNGTENRTPVLRSPSRTRLLDPGRLPAYLIGRGLLDASQVVDGDLTVIEASRRNHNVHIDAGNHTGFVLKMGASRGERPGTVLYEARVYEVLGQEPWAGVLGGRIPRSFGFDRAIDRLVVERMGGEENLRDLQQRTGEIDVPLARTVGDTLGRLHRPEPGTTNLSHDFPEVFALTLPRFGTLHGTSIGMQNMITVLQNMGNLTNGLRGLKEDWRHTALIHGDPRWDNWVVIDPLPGAEPAEGRLALVDWEFGGIGEPGWDVGSALGDYLAAWVFSIPELPGVRLDRGLPLSGFHIDVLRPAMDALWGAYLAQRQPLDAGGELTMTARCTAAKLIQLCAERMHHQTELTATIGALLQLADHIFAEPDRAAAELMGITASCGHVGAS